MTTLGQPLSLVHLDDDPFERERVKKALESNDLGAQFKVYSTATADEFEKTLARVNPAIVLLDIHLDSDTTDGIALGTLVKRDYPQTAVLIFSTADDAPTIGKCLTGGADDFISKQSDKGELSLRIANSYRLVQLKNIPAAPPKSRPRKEMKFTGATMQTIAKRVPLLLNSAVSAIHIIGESGTGKEVVADLFANAIDGVTPFVKVNCGSIAPNLLESELFGHVKGAFTGATADKKGYFEAANGGWIFLDELGTLPGPAQVALLRVLENGEVIRVGSSRPIAVKVRVISATNADLEEMVEEKTFRKDLWQRLQETEIHLPPLRERLDEIPDLVEHFCSTMTGGPYRVSGPAMEVLCSASWQNGNIRELRNCLRAMTEMHIDRLLTPLSIPARIWEELGDAPTGSSDQSSSRPVASEEELCISLKDGTNFESLQDLLLLALVESLAKKNGKMSIRSLSAAIGVSRSTLSGRLKSLLQRERTTPELLSRWVGIGEK